MKYISFIIISMIISVGSFAQDPQIQWQNTIGGNLGDLLTSIQQTSDGGYICGGYSWSDISGDKMDNSKGASDYWVVKLDLSGNILWQNSIGGSNLDGLTSIQQTADGGYICGGYSESNISGDKTENSLGDNDYWIVKLDSVGNILWQNTIGGASSDWLTSIQQTTDGGYICGGYSESNISGDKTENNLGIWDYWVVKLNASGNILWQNTIGGNSVDDLRSIQQTSDGGYICGGFSSSDISGDKAENSIGDNDFWVVKLDTSGNITWQNTIGGNGSDKLYTLHQTADEGYICGGYSRSNISGDKTEDSQGLQDYWIVKLDLNGNIQWQNTIGGSSWDQLNSILQIADGGYICGGYSWSDISGDKAENSLGREDYWVVKLDTIGQIQWQNTIGGNDSDWLNYIQQTIDGGYVCGGWSKSGMLGDKTEISQGDYDYWVVKLKGDPNLIYGNVFVDLNLNNKQDTTEPGYPLGNIQSTQQSLTANTIPGANGVFYLPVDSGSWTTSFISSNLNHVTVTPVIHVSNFGNQRNQIDTVNFAVQLIPGHPDLCIEILPLTPARPGFNVTYRLIATNVGTDTITGNVQFNHDSILTLLTTNPNYTSYTNPIVSWNFSNFAPLQTLTFDVTFNIPAPPTVNIGALLSSVTTINPIATDEHPSNNFDNIRHLVRGSFDPNDKWVNTETVLDTALPYNEHLDYLIRFQNTGTDTAFRVIVRDTLDYLLDQSTLNIIHASHDYLVIKRDSNVLEFQFNNILLADSNTNEPSSHGYIAYQIKPKSTFGVGDVISNRAAIYFDYNPPILTNTVTSEAVIATGIGEQSNTLPLTVYPNPTNGKLTISAVDLEWKNATINLYNTLGQVVIEKKVKHKNISKYTMNVSALKAGVYELVIFESENKYSAKIIIE